MNNTNIKSFTSKDYNFIFNKQSGVFARWGKTYKHDPLYSVSPEIADIEITTQCNGVKGDGNVCAFCYKSNTSDGIYMTDDTFHNIIRTFDHDILTQVALGVDACVTNCEFDDIANICKYYGIIPNVTLANLTYTPSRVRRAIGKYCGGVAISIYDKLDSDSHVFNTIERLSVQYINFHLLLSKETLPIVNHTIEYYSKNKFLKSYLTALVFLSLKKVGRGKSGYTPLTQDEFDSVLDRCLYYNVPFGFDSCSAPKAVKAAIKFDIYDKIKDFIEPCESTLFSSYINVEGKFFPCSFAEGSEGWEEGINVLKYKKFTDVWNHKRTVEFRNKLLANTDENGIRCCPLHEV